MIGIKTIFLNSKDFEFRGDRVDRLIYLLQQVHATQYLSGPSAKHYLDGYEHKFTDNSIVLTYKEYSGYPIYNQLSAPFEQAVSILDMIANIELSRISDYIWGWRSSEHAAESDIPDSVNPTPYHTTG